MNPVKFMAVLVMAIVLEGCSTPPIADTTIESLPLTLHTLNCRDQILGEMVTRCVQECLAENVGSKVTFDNGAQSGILITGSIHFKDMSSGSGSSRAIVVGGGGGGSSESSSFSGGIVEGVMLVASRDGHELCSATYFQRVEKGEYQSPQDVAEAAAERLLGKLEELKLVVVR